MKVHVREKIKAKNETYNKWIVWIKRDIEKGKDTIILPSNNPYRSHLVNNKNIKKLIRKYNLRVMFIPYHYEGYNDSMENILMNTYSEVCGHS